LSNVDFSPNLSLFVVYLVWLVSFGPRCVRERTYDRSLRVRLQFHKLFSELVVEFLLTPLLELLAVLSRQPTALIMEWVKNPLPVLKTACETAA
jgi:hypothetical protein